MTLLQADVAPSLIIQDKQVKSKDGDGSDQEIKENTSVNILSENALLPTATPSTENEEAPSPDDISIYVVKKGDSLAAIAKMFGVKVNTILWANDMKKGDKLVNGATLIILPIDGVEHTVTRGQTLKGLAKLYKVEVSDIASFNGISENTKLAIDDNLIIPEGEIHLEETNSNTTLKPKDKVYESGYIQQIVGYFTNPVPGSRRSRGITGKHRGVDFAALTGTPILASAGGVVQFARTGWNGAYGNMVILKHLNGTKTLYAHMSELGTYTGAQVAKGEVIGYVGNTGRSRGAHLHFEVLGAKNPF